MFLFALLAIHQQQLPDLNQKVTLDMRAVQGVTLMRELSRKTGISFEAHNAAATDRYLVTVRDVPLKQLMDKLAEAETGVWLNAGDNQFRLVRDRAKIEKEQKDDRETSIKQYSEVLEKCRKDLGQLAEFSPDNANEVASKINHLGPPPNDGVDASGYWQQVNDLEQQLPMQRFVEKVVLDFTPEQLADMPARIRTVYAVNPTAMQLPLPSDATDAISELVKEQQCWEEALTKYLPNRGNEQLHGGLRTGGRSAQISNAMLSFDKPADNGDIMVSLRLLDARGHVLGSSGIFIGPPNPPEPSSKPSPPPKPEPPIPLSKSDIEMAMLFKNTDWRGTNISSAVSESIRRAIVSPTKFDPLNTFVTDIIEGFAASHKQNVVAVLDDRLTRILSDAVTEKGFDPRQIDRVTLVGAQGFDFGSGFFDMWEGRPARSDKSNCNRALLEEMIAGSISAGHLTVKLAANYAAPLERFRDSHIAEVYVAALFGPAGANALTSNNSYLLRLYGLLDDVPRNGDKVALAGITGEAGELLNLLIFGINSRLDVQLPPPTPEELRDPLYGHTDFSEPTIALGDGVPIRSYVAIDPASDRVIIADVQYPTYHPGRQLFEPKALASISVDSENDRNGTKVRGMVAADRDLVKFYFKFTNTVSMTMQLSYYMTTSQQTADINALPDDVRRALLDAMSQERKNRQGSGVVRNSNNGPP
jgi:hypothetical protein